MSAHRNSAGTNERPRRLRAAVMADVARLAGVSHQTVSRVVNGSDQVRADTRDRVLAAMRMLDYRPNPLARALVTGRSRTIGVVSFDTTLYGPASTLFGVERAAHEAGYFTSIFSLTSLDRPSVVSAVEHLRGQGVEGILVVAPLRAAAAALAAVSTDVPLVAAEGGPEGHLPVAAVDQHAGAAMATRHLLELGHPTVHHLAGPEDWLETEGRIAGWRDTLALAGAEIFPPLRGDWSPRAGYEIGCQLIERPGVTAVFVANDQMALGLLRAVHEHGREVPRDISVVGFDDIPEAAYFTPPLTTVRQDFMEMGRRGLHLLLTDISRGTRSSTRDTVIPDLIVRSSAGTPSAG